MKEIGGYFQLEEMPGERQQSHQRLQQKGGDILV